MTTLLQLASRQYLARTLSRTVTLSAAEQSVLIELTRESWPAGVVINTISITDPNGNIYAANGIVGGTAFNRDGTVRTVQDMLIEAPPNADGSAGNLPAGSYAVFIDIAQPITTSVTVTATP